MRIELVVMKKMKATKIALALIAVIGLSAIITGLAHDVPRNILY